MVPAAHFFMRLWGRYARTHARSTRIARCLVLLPFARALSPLRHWPGFVSWPCVISCVCVSEGRMEREIFGLLQRSRFRTEADPCCPTRHWKKILSTPRSPLWGGERGGERGLGNDFHTFKAVLRALMEGAGWEKETVPGNFWAAASGSPSPNLYRCLDQERGLLREGTPRVDRKWGDSRKSFISAKSAPREFLYRPFSSLSYFRAWFLTYVHLEKKKGVWEESVMKGGFKGLMWEEE